MRLSRRKIAKLYKTTNQSRRATKDIGSGKRKTGGNRSRRATALNLRRRTMKGRRMNGGEDGIEEGGKGGGDEVEEGVDEVEEVEEAVEEEVGGEDEVEEGVDEVEATEEAEDEDEEEARAEDEVSGLGEEGVEPANPNSDPVTDVDSVPGSAPTAIEEADIGNVMPGEHDNRNNINDNNESDGAPSQTDVDNTPTEEQRADVDAPTEEPLSDETPTSILGDGVRKLDFEEIIDRVKILTADPGSPAVLMTDPEDYAQFITGIVNIAIQVVDDRINEKIKTAIDTRLAGQRTEIEDAVL